MDQIRANTNQSGPIASLPSTTGQKSGNRYKCTDSPYEYVFNGTSWDAYIFGYLVTEPKLANFTQVNVGLSTFDTTHGGILWTSTNAGGHNVQVLSQTAGIPGAGAYFVDSAFIASYGSGNGAFGTGLAAGLTSATAFSFADWGCENSGIFGMGAKYYNSTTSYNGSAGTVAMLPLGTPLMWLRMFDDRTTNRKYYYSANGYQWYQIFSEARTTLYTPAFATMAVTNFSDFGAFMHVVHFAVHA